jgi:hypothetical protein
VRFARARHHRLIGSDVRILLRSCCMPRGPRVGGPFVWSASTTGLFGCASNRPRLRSRVGVEVMSSLAKDSQERRFLPGPPLRRMGPNHKGPGGPLLRRLDFKEGKGVLRSGISTGACGATKYPVMNLHGQLVNS